MEWVGEGLVVIEAKESVISRSGGGGSQWKAINKGERERGKMEGQTEGQEKPCFLCGGGVLLRLPQAHHRQQQRQQSV
jgi:hypothetical protein